LPLFRDSAGKKVLQDAKLLPVGKLDYNESEVDIRMTNGEGTAGEDFDGMFVDSSRRPRIKVQKKNTFVGGTGRLWY